MSYIAAYLVVETMYLYSHIYSELWLPQRTQKYVLAMIPVPKDSKLY